MRKLIVSLIMIVTLAGTGCSANDMKAPSHTRLGVSYTMAQSANKPMLLFFYADWCTYCQRFMPKLKLIDAIYKNAYSIVMINCEDPMNKKIVDDYYISVYPTLYISDRKNNTRIHIDNAYYDNIDLLRRELDRYISSEQKAK